MRTRSSCPRTASLVGLAVAPLDVREDAFPLGLVLGRGPRPVSGCELEASPGAPYRSAFCAAVGSSPQGVLRSNLSALASVGQDRLAQVARRARPTAGRRPRGSRCSGRRGSSSAFTSRRVPRPSQSGQAPKGELNENWRGSSSGSERPQTGQAKRSEKSCDCSRPVASCRTTSTTPSASLSAVSIESVRRPRSVAPHDQAIDDDGDVVVLPAIAARGRRRGRRSRRRRAPGRSRASATSSNRSRNSPFRPRTSGASTSMRVPSGHARTASVICAGARAGDRAAVVGAVGHADARPEQPQVVVDLGDGADRRARVVPGGLLLDRDGRREALDRVDVGLLHQARGTAGRRPRATRRSAAGPRRRSCRRRATTCPSPRAR